MQGSHRKSWRKEPLQVPTAIEFCSRRIGCQRVQPAGKGQHKQNSHTHTTRLLAYLVRHTNFSNTSSVAPLPLNSSSQTPAEGDLPLDPVVPVRLDPHKARHEHVRPAVRSPHPPASEGEQPWERRERGMHGEESRGGGGGARLCRSGLSTFRAHQQVCVFVCYVFSYTFSLLFPRPLASERRTLTWQISTLACTTYARAAHKLARRRSKLDTSQSTCRDLAS